MHYSGLLNDVLVCYTKTLQHNEANSQVFQIMKCQCAFQLQAKLRILLYYYVIIIG